MKLRRVVPTTSFAPAAEPVAHSRPSDGLEQTTLVSGWQFVRGDLGGIGETLRSCERALDLPTWTTVELPHCVNARDAVDPDVPYDQGPAWYRTELALAPRRRRRLNPHRAPPAASPA